MLPWILMAVKRLWSFQKKSCRYLNHANINYTSIFRNVDNQVVLNKSKEKNVEKPGICIHKEVHLFCFYNCKIMKS